jgi:RimJ/RimL family protein N-acetyltransferase
VFAVMLGGVRTPTQTQEELARDVVAWGAEGFGIWAIRETGSGVLRNDRPRAGFVGITGLECRPDGRGVALRFALWPEAQGRGLAREAAGAALRFGHDEAGLARIVAVARASNFASRMVLGGIGMTACDSFIQNGWPMVLYESLRCPSPVTREG